MAAKGNPWPICRSMRRWLGVYTVHRLSVPGTTVNLHLPYLSHRDRKIWPAIQFGLRREPMRRAALWWETRPITSMRPCSPFPGWSGTRRLSSSATSVLESQRMGHGGRADARCAQNPDRPKLEAVRAREPSLDD
jgi:hypothetical protein